MVRRGRSAGPVCRYLCAPVSPPTSDEEVVAAAAVRAVAADLSCALQGQATPGAHLAAGVWSRLAKWLGTRPAPPHSAHAASVIRLLEAVAGHQGQMDDRPGPLVSHPQRAVLAALLVRARPEHQLAGLRLLTGPMAIWDVNVVRFLLQVAASYQPGLREQVVAQHCRILLDSRLPNLCRQDILMSVRSIDADAAAAFLTQRCTADPYMVTTNVLRLGPQYRADAVGYVQRRALHSLDGVLESWSKAASVLLGTGSRGDREEMARILKEIALRTEVSATQALAVTAVLASHNRAEAGPCAGHIARSAAASDTHRMAAAGLLARLGAGPDYESVVLDVLDRLDAQQPPPGRWPSPPMSHVSARQYVTGPRHSFAPVCSLVRKDSPRSWLWPSWPVSAPPPEPAFAAILYGCYEAQRTGGSGLGFWRASPCSGPTCTRPPKHCCLAEFGHRKPRLIALVP